MITAGIDVGAKSTKVIILKDGDITGRGMGMLEMDREKSIKEIFNKCLAEVGLSINDIDYIISTGAGRKFVPFAQGNLTMVTCDATGIVRFEPSVRTVIDIGANEARAIRCDATGKVIDFAVNEKCAAGAGAFVEAMARAMEVSIEEFAELSLKAEKTIPINAQCAIFAESEVVSMKNRGIPPKDVANAVHLSVVNRLTAMLNRVGFGESIVFSGGVARNPCIVKMLQERLDCVKVESPSAPDIVGALGAALYADRC